jgi:hypothetical protein
MKSSSGRYRIWPGLVKTAGRGRPLLQLPDLEEELEPEEFDLERVLEADESWSSLSDLRAGATYRRAQLRGLGVVVTRGLHAKALVLGVIEFVSALSCPLRKRPPILFEAVRLGVVVVVFDSAMMKAGWM